MIGLIVDLRHDSDATTLEAARDVAYRVGRENIPAAIVTTAGIEQNGAGVDLPAREAPDSGGFEPPNELIERIASAWSLRGDQIIFLSPDPEAIETANEDDALIVRIAGQEDPHADFTFATIDGVLPIVASEYTAGLLEVRFVLMQIAN